MTTPRGAPSSGQLAVLEHLYGVHLSNSPPSPSAEPEEALALLGLNRDYQGLGAHACLASYREDLLSVPGVGRTPVPLLDVLSEEARTLLSSWKDKLLISEAESAKLHQEGVQVGCYTDPKLSRSPKACHQFIRKLFNAGLITFTTSS